MSPETQCPKLVEARRCIYALGHGGDCYSPNDSADHSDEIRIQILRDRIAELEEHLAEQKPAEAS